MSNVIRIKRRASGSAGAPSSLMDSELAYNQVDDTIWIGKGTGGAGGSATTIEAIAGKGAFLALAGSQVVTGDKEFSGAIDFSGTIEIDGVELTATAAELNKLAGVTPGVASAGKALVVDSNKDLTIDGDLQVAGMTITGDLVVQGQVTTISSETLVVADKNIVLADGATTDAAANGGGFTIKGATDHTFIYSNAGSSFVSSESLDVASGRVFKVDGVEVLSATALGSSVTSSSLESVGVLSSGTWEADTIAIAHGGTGATTAQAAIDALSQVSGASVGHVLTKVGSNAVWAAPADTGVSSINGLTDDTQTFATGTSGSDFGISSESGVHTFNLPDASSSARGLVTTGTQTFAGAKTFAGNLTVSASNVNLTLHNTEGGRDASFAMFNNRLYLTRSGGNLAGNWAFTIDMESHQVGINRYTPGAQLHVGINNSSEKGFVVTGKPGQSANLLELQDSDENALFSVDSSGAVIAGAWEGDAVAIAHGGTGESTAQDAINALTDVASASAGQVLTKVGSDAVWAEPADTGISSINGLTDDTQTFAIGTDASNEVPYWSSSAGVHTLHLPYATNAVRGLVSNTNQVFGGRKCMLDGATVGEASGLGGTLDVYSTGSSPAVLVKKASGSTGSAFKFVDHTNAVVFEVNASGAVTTGTWSGSAIPVANGGTGATTVAGAQQALEVEPGVDVQPYSDKLQALVDLSGSFASGVIKIVGYSDSETAEYVDTTTFSRSLLDDATASAARTTLELVPGVDVMGYDQELAALAGLVSAADKMPYFTGSGTAAVADFTSFGRSLVDDASPSAARSTLELGSISTQSSDNVSITGGSISNIELDGGSF